MIFSVKVNPSNYEEIECLLINADSIETALYLAEKEVKEHNEHLGIEIEPNFNIKEVDLKNNKILATVINW